MPEIGPISGRCWLFAGANINTDLLMPSASFHLPRERQAAMVLEGLRPGWSAQVQAGDVLVAGRNFGTGSGRPAPQLLAHLGIAAVVAESISDLFYRNCVNAGLPAMECPGIATAVGEGELLTVDVVNGRVLVQGAGRELRGTRMPELLLEILSAGGLLARLEKEGYVQ